MNDHGQWLIDLESGSVSITVDGLVPVDGYNRDEHPPEEVTMMEKARAYGAHSVFFEAGRNGRPRVAQAFVFVSDGPADDTEFAELHQRLWSWGGVPLVYRKMPGLVQLFRCAHEPDFVSASGDIICKPFRELDIAATIASSEPWWDDARLSNGTLWDDPAVCEKLLSAEKSAHRQLVEAVKELNTKLNSKRILEKRLRRKLLILSLLISYLEARKILTPEFFRKFDKNATRFFEILGNGKALVALLCALDKKFNGHVFRFDKTDLAVLETNRKLRHYANFVEARTEPGGQLTLWELYSFEDLPVEVISNIYQIFVDDTDSSVYTPPFLVRLMLEEVLSWDRLDRLERHGEIILDPACGSGVFLVEAYKRLVLHWRSRNHWKQPSIPVLTQLLKKVHGTDREESAVELAAFSLCLSLCDALDNEDILASKKLFPPLLDDTLHFSCFFEAKENSLLKGSVGVVVGNPPFESKPELSTLGAKRSYEKYKKTYGSPPPDKQLAYLFLHEAMDLVAKGGVLSMLQKSGFLYNAKSRNFRHRFMTDWDVREVLDFSSVRGLFSKGDADPLVIVIVADAVTPPSSRKILHATFRRSGRVDAEQGFDIDYYDLHWLPRELVLNNDVVWTADLLGGGRTLGFADRLGEFRTLEEYAEDQKGWDIGEGFIEGKKGKRSEAEHITGKKHLATDGLTDKGIDRNKIDTFEGELFKSAYTKRRYTPPMLLIKEQMDLAHVVWEEHYLTYKARIVGLCAPREQSESIRNLGAWMTTFKRPLQAYIAATSLSLFSQRATAILKSEVLSIPFPDNGNLDLSNNEQIIVDDIVDYYCDLIRLGESSILMKENGRAALSSYSKVFTSQINSIYEKNPLRTLEAQTWPGIICQPFVFGDGKVDWDGADDLKGRLDALLQEQISKSLYVTRIARIYDGNFIFLLKSNRLRYWLRSVALRDADDTLTDLRAQGF